MKKNKKGIFIITLLLVFGSIAFFTINRYGLDHLVVIFNRIVNF